MTLFRSWFMWWPVHYYSYRTCTCQCHGVWGRQLGWGHQPGWGRIVQGRVGPDDRERAAWVYVQGYSPAVETHAHSPWSQFQFPQTVLACHVGYLPEMFKLRTETVHRFHTFYYYDFCLLIIVQICWPVYDLWTEWPESLFRELIIVWVCWDVLNVKAN